MDAGEKMQRFTRLSLNPLTIFNSLKCRPDPIITRHPPPTYTYMLYIQVH